MNKELLERLENLPLIQAASSDINVFLREVFTEFEILVAANGKKTRQHHNSFTGMIRTCFMSKMPVNQY